MHIITKKEGKKRGCSLCHHVKDSSIEADYGNYQQHIKMCEFNECPYHELDGFDDYTDYENSVIKDGFDLTSLFKLI